MNITDKNNWLEAPEGYTLVEVEGSGAYIVVTYMQILDSKNVSQISIFLNSDGREVCRVSEVLERENQETASLWQKFLAWFLSTED
jgi:hypothetical protein